MKLLKYMACAGAIALGFMGMTSCNGDKEDYVVTQTLPGCINWVADGREGHTFVSGDVAYRVNTNLTKQVCDITIENLALPSGQRYTSLAFENLPYTIKDDAWRVVKVANVMPTSSVLAPMFNDLEFVLADRVVGSAYYPALQISYTVSGVKFYSTLSMLVSRGTTEVVSENGNKYVQDQENGAVYMIALDYKKMTATMAIEGAKFDNNMPALNMEFRNIPFEFTEDGMVEMDQDKLETPYVIGSDNTSTPFEAATITDFKCEADCSNNMALSFTCTMRMGPTPTVYSAKVDCKGY